MEEEFVEEVTVVDREGWRRRNGRGGGFMGSNSNSAGCHEVWHMAVRADSCAHGTALERTRRYLHRHSNEFATVFVSQVTTSNAPPVGVALS